MFPIETGQWLTSLGQAPKPRKRYFGLFGPVEPVVKSVKSSRCAFVQAPDPTQVPDGDLPASTTYFKSVEHEGRQVWIRTHAVISGNVWNWGILPYTHQPGGHIGYER